MIGLLLVTSAVAEPPPKANLPPKPATPGAPAPKPTAPPDPAKPNANDLKPADLWSKLIAPRPHGEAWVVPPNTIKDGAPAWGGGFALGRILTPPVHGDARPWPDGILIVPPDVNDPMAIEPGSNALRLGTKRTLTLPQALSRDFKYGADRFWDLVLPKSI